MRGAVALVAVVLGAGLAACWDFQGAYDACLSTGRCGDGGGPGGGDGGDGGGGGGGDGGDGGGATCPAGVPTGNGLCLVERFDRLAPMYGIYATSPDQIFFGGYDEAVSTWQSGRMDDAVTGQTFGNVLNDLSGTSSNEIWAAIGSLGSSSYVYRWDGAVWRDATPGGFTAGDCHGAFSDGAGSAYLACDLGLWRVTAAGSGQSVLSATGVGFSGVWGVPGGPAWAVGGDSTVGTGYIWQGSGTSWTGGLVPSATGVLQAVHGRSDHDVWAVGKSAALMHLDDAGWHPVSSALAGDLVDVFVTSAGEAWVTNGQNRVMVVSTDGGQRAFVPPGLPSLPGNVFLQQVQVFDSGDVWFTAVTDDGGTQFDGAEFHYRLQ